MVKGVSVCYQSGNDTESSGFLTIISVSAEGIPDYRRICRNLELAGCVFLLCIMVLGAELIVVRNRHIITADTLVVRHAGVCLLLFSAITADFGLVVSVLIRVKVIDARPDFR